MKKSFFLLGLAWLLLGLSFAEAQIELKAKALESTYTGYRQKWPTGDYSITQITPYTPNKFRAIGVKMMGFQLVPHVVEYEMEKGTGELAVPLKEGEIKVLSAKPIDDEMKGAVALLSPKADLVAIMAYDYKAKGHALKILKADSYEVVLNTVLEGTKAKAYRKDFAFSPDQKYFSVLLADGTEMVLEIEGGKVAYSAKNEDTPAESIAFDQGSKRVAFFYPFKKKAYKARGNKSHWMNLVTLNDGKNSVYTSPEKLEISHGLFINDSLMRCLSVKGELMEYNLKQEKFGDEKPSILEYGIIAKGEVSLGSMLKSIGGGRLKDLYIGNKHYIFITTVKNNVGLIWDDIRNKPRFGFSDPTGQDFPTSCFAYEVLNPTPGVGIEHYFTINNQIWYLPDLDKNKSFKNQD